MIAVKHEIPRGDRNELLEGDDSISKFFFSRIVQIGSLVVCGSLLAMTFAIITMTGSASKALPLIIASAMSVVATVALWTRSRYALFAWSGTAALMGIFTIIYSNYKSYTVLYWVERFGIALVLFSVAWSLLIQSRRGRVARTRYVRRGPDRSGPNN